MRAFKGFNKDLTCRGYQYEEGKEFHTERAEIILRYLLQGIKEPHLLQGIKEPHLLVILLV